MIDRNVITFVGEDGTQKFLASVEDEAACDRFCHVRTVGAILPGKRRPPDS